MDILWDDDSDIQEKANARLILYGRLQVVRPYEEENSPWWSANTNPNYPTYAKRHPVEPSDELLDSPREDDDEVNL